jgi:saccharopine dehydrogenase (NADP+, L-glutamate forming)
MVLMIHEIEYLLSGKNMLHKAELKVIGENAMHTAMAKTVGLPLGIAASLLLKGELLLTGLHIPTHPHIYNLVLPLLEKEGVCFNTSTQSV